MRFLKRLLALAFVASFPAIALAQTYPTANPTYVPQAILAAESLTAAGNVVFNVNGAATVYVRLSGTFTGLASTLQGTESRAASPTWTSLGADLVGTGRISAITAAGLYRINTAGLAQIRLNVTALTVSGSNALSVAMSGGPGDQFITQLPAPRATYSASALIGTGATNHFLVVAGSAAKVIRISHVECTGGATAANDVSITAEVDSAADTGDAGTAVTAVPHDSTDPVATAGVLSHTTSPTPGALVGLVRSGNLLLAKLGASTPTGMTPLIWDFGGIRPGEQEITLRGVAQLFALNTSAAFGSGAAVGCAVSWTEE